MTPSQDHITIRLLDPASRKVQRRRVQWRTMCGFRNTGSVLMHRPAASPGRHGLANVPVVVDDFESLCEHHSTNPDAVYELVNRPTYHIPTFAAALSIVGDPAVPVFSSTADIRPDFRKFYTLLNNAERNQLTSEWAEAGPLRRKGRITNRYDCLMSNDRASAFVGTSVAADTPDTAVEVLKDFQDTCAYAHFLSTRVQDARQREQWGAFFSRQTFMFYGLPDSAVSAGSRDAIWAAVAAAPDSAVPTNLVAAEPALAAAARLGIALLLRRPSSHGYRLLRLMAP